MKWKGGYSVGGGTANCELLAQESLTSLTVFFGSTHLKAEEEDEVDTSSKGKHANLLPQGGKSKRSQSPFSMELDETHTLFRTSHWPFSEHRSLIVETINNKEINRNNKGGDRVR